MNPLKEAWIHKQEDYYMSVQPRHKSFYTHMVDKASYDTLLEENKRLQAIVRTLTRATAIEGSSLSQVGQRCGPVESKQR